jgi:hypothetical protein
MKRTLLLSSLLIQCAIAPTCVQAGEVTGLTPFTPGTPARAAEVNGNFGAVKTAVDDNHSRITTLETTTEGLQSSVSAAQATIASQGARITALEMAPDPLGPLMYGDGSAGDVVLSGTVNWGQHASTTNPNFNNLTIASGASVYVPSGVTIRCAGTFTNNGTIFVQTGAMGGQVSSGDIDGGERAIAPAHPGSTRKAAGVPSSSDDGMFIVRLDGGASGLAPLSGSVLSSLSSISGGGGGGGGVPGSVGGAGGGIVRVYARDAMANSGNVYADGTSGGGGGGGGLIVLASRTSVSNTGLLSARGGDGAASTAVRGASGGGGGGLVVLVSPATAAGTVNVPGGAGGSNAAAVTSPTFRAGGGGGGAGVGGNGSSGGNVSGGFSDSTMAGAAGEVILLQQDPLFLTLH